jgi:hypothetical protein
VSLAVTLWHREPQDVGLRHVGRCGTSSSVNMAASPLAHLRRPVCAAGRVTGLAGARLRECVAGSASSPVLRAPQAAVGAHGPYTTVVGGKRDPSLVTVERSVPRFHGHGPEPVRRRGNCRKKRRWMKSRRRPSRSPDRHLTVVLECPESGVRARVARRPMTAEVRRPHRHDRDSGLLTIMAT